MVRILGLTGRKGELTGRKSDLSELHCGKLTWNLKRAPQKKKTTVYTESPMFHAIFSGV